MLNKIQLIVLALAFIGVSTAKAQSTDTAKMWGWHNRDVAGAMQIQVIYRKSNTLQLNQDLVNVGIPAVTSPDVWINLSMAHYNNNWIMEDGLGFTPWESSTSANNLKATYSEYQLYFRLGYNVSNSADFKLYPFIGANLSGAVLDIQDNARIQQVTNFSQEILNSTSSKTFYQPNFGVELGAGLDYFIKLKPKQIDCIKIQRSIPIGLRAGYYINTYASDWKIDNYALNNGPSAKQSAVFVSLNIGLGYMIKK